MMPTLIAEESLREAERVGVGTGTYKPGARREILRRWQTEAGRAQPTRTRALSPEEFGAMGIALVIKEQAARG